MRFMMLYKPGRESDSPPTQQEMADMGPLIDDMAKAGVLIATGGLHWGGLFLRDRRVPALISARA